MGSVCEEPELVQTYACGEGAQLDVVGRDQIQRSRSDVTVRGSEEVFA